MKLSEMTADEQAQILSEQFDADDLVDICNLTADDICYGNWDKIEPYVNNGDFDEE